MDHGFRRRRRLGRREGELRHPFAGLKLCPIAARRNGHLQSLAGFREATAEIPNSFAILTIGSDQTFS